MHKQAKACCRTQVCQVVAFPVTAHCFLSGAAAVFAVFLEEVVAGNSEVTVVVAVVFNCQRRAGFVWPAHSSGICFAPLICEGLRNH